MVIPLPIENSEEPTFEVKKGGDLYRFIENELNSILNEGNGLARRIDRLH